MKNIYRRIAESQLRVRKESWTLRMRIEDNLLRDLAFKHTKISHEEVAIRRFGDSAIL